MDIEIFLTHLIHSGWVKKFQMSMLVFDIAQFFLSLNHWLLLVILSKAGFNLKISSFFSNYLISRKTQYLWNSFTSPFFYIDVGVGQGSVLSPILSILYLSPIFHIFEKRVKNLKIPVLFLSFVDDRLFISQEKSLEKTNSHLFCSYNIISSLLEQFRLAIEHGKSEVLFFQIAWPLQPAPTYRCLSYHCYYQLNTFNALDLQSFHPSLSIAIYCCTKGS